MNISSNVNFLLGLQAQLKVLHWQTKSYAKHNALDKTLDELIELTDSFVEEAMGKYGRFKLEDTTKNIELNNLADIDIDAMIDTVCDALIQFNEQFEKTDTNLLNIRDEILGLFRKLKYLLTLK